MEEIRVADWAELHERLYENAYQPALGRTRSPYVFRGLSDVDYPLTTTLMRLGGDFVAMEHHLLRNFRKYAKQEVVEQDSIWNWLAVAQHHGLPTRLLDWTFSPHVAMHFATSLLDQFHRDGVIWTVDFTRAHRLLPERLRTVLAGEGSEIFTTEMLANTAATLAELAHLKWEIRDRLDQANITERVLFPGLDGLSRWLTRYYSPRDAAVRAAGDRIAQGRHAP